MESSFVPQLSCCVIVAHSRKTRRLGNLHNLLKFQGFCASYGFGDPGLAAPPRAIWGEGILAAIALPGGSLWLNQFHVCPQDLCAIRRERPAASLPSEVVGQFLHARLHQYVGV